jgi:hypothetical protein
LCKGKQEWTIYRNWQQWVHKTQDEDKLIKGKQEWTIYRNWQQWVHKTQDEDKLIKGKQEWTIYLIASSGVEQLLRYVFLCF